MPDQNASGWNHSRWFDSPANHVPFWYTQKVKIVGEFKLIAFGEKHPPARNSLNRWADVVEEAAWKSPVEMKQSFGSADVVGRQESQHRRKQVPLDRGD